MWLFHPAAVNIGNATIRSRPKPHNRWRTAFLLLLAIFITHIVRGF